MKKYRITLTFAERKELRQYIESGKTNKQKLCRAWLMLNLDESEWGPKLSDQEASPAFGITVRSCENLRKRFVELGFEVALNGFPPHRNLSRIKLDGTFEARLIALNCGSAPAGYGKWSLRLLADRLVELQYIDAISHESVRQVLKKNELKPWKHKYYVIPPDNNAEFVYRMERVLDIYHRPYDPANPVICMDESPNQMIGEIKKPYRTSTGEKRSDYEYVRNGTVSIFMACEPLAGQRIVKIKDTHKTSDWVNFMEVVFKTYQDAQSITVVLDNLSTHKPAAFYEYFSPEKAHQMLAKFEFVFTPKHGSWLNIAEIELNTLKGQCLNRRIAKKEEMIEQVDSWQKDRNTKNSVVDWQFSTKEARIKLKRLYPKTIT